MIAYHYTTGQKFQDIILSGILMPTRVGVPVGEKPILWFSKNAVFEPTSTKAVRRSDGSVKRLTMVETYRLAGGLVRFGVETETLTPWVRLPTVAGMKAKERVRLEEAGRQQGANPFDWFGCLEGRPIDSCICIEVMNSVMEWEVVQ